MVRRAFDIAVSLGVLLLLAIPFLFIAAATRWGSPGPAFFIQPRVGRGGRIFGLCKFRTMRASGGGPSITAQGDPRITPIGAFLRRWKIDELPQFWNVLRGDMSIVGPRPEVIKFVDLYTEDQRRILDTKPGLASMAQILFSHEAESLAGSPDPEKEYVEDWMPRKIEADLAYEAKRGFWRDLVFLGEVVLLVLGVRRRRTVVTGKRSRGDRGAAGTPPGESSGRNDDSASSHRAETG